MSRLCSAVGVAALCLAEVACTTQPAPHSPAVYDAQRVTAYAAPRRDGAQTFLQKGADEFVLWDASSNGAAEIGAAGKRIFTVGALEWVQPLVAPVTPILRAPPAATSAVVYDAATTARPVETPSPPPTPRPEQITITFAFNSEMIDDAGKDALRAAVAHGFTAQRITGHADQRGSLAFNESLSQRRAAAVLAFLQSLGARPDVAQASLVAKGKSELETTDESSEGRSRNRRVVIDGEKP